MRHIFSLAIFLTFLGAKAQQRPFINHLDKTSATVGETISISGSGFPSGANLRVNFGAGIANVVSSETTLITATVPVSATPGPVTVTNLSTNLSANSSQTFIPSFSGGAFDETAVDSQEIFNTNIKFTYDLCACDFDGDGLIDIGIANNSDESTLESVMKNNSTLTSTVFISQDVPKEFQIISTECGDLNGDGRPELVHVSGDNQKADPIIIYENTSTVGTISFANSLIKLSTPEQSSGNRRNLRKFKLGDIDGDGRVDLVVGNQSDNTLLIYLNTSSGTTITFGAPFQVPVNGAANVGAIDIGDLNGDGLIDIAIVPFQENNAVIYILTNESSPGSVQFEQAANINAPSNWRNILIADLNNDEKKDLIVSSVLTDLVSVFQNTSTGTDVTFNNTASTTSVTDPWGLNVADMNGDGLLDILVAPTQPSVYILENQSSGSVFSFSAKTISVTSTNRNIAGIDLNGDAKPDIAFANNSSESALGNLSIITNRNCLAPEVGPTDITFCLNTPFTIQATKSAETAYSWEVTSGDATITPNGDEADVVVNSGTSATVEVSITSNDGNCIDVATQTFSLTGTTPPADPTITNSVTGTVCFGESFTLSGPTGFAEYLWTAPNGTPLPNTSSISLTNVSATDAGAYTLRVRPTGGCFSKDTSLLVAVDEPPVVTIVNTDEDNFCETSSITLEVADYPGFSYQWFRDGAAISGQTSSTLTVSDRGTYFVSIISNVSGCENRSEPYTVNTVVEPIPGFTSVDEICRNVEITFDASTSIGQSGFDLNYAWNFGDGNTGDGSDVTHIYTSTGIFDVVLTTNYVSIGGCSTSVTRQITVSEAPSIASIESNISPVESARVKCPEDSVLLSISGYQNSIWRINGSETTSSSVYVKTESNEEEVTVEVDVITDIGCVITGATATVSNFENSRIQITSPDQVIENDTIRLGNGISTVILNAVNGSEYTWEPASILDNSNSVSVTAFPKDQFTTVQVTGIDAINGCQTTASVVIETPGLIPRKSFSPNGDGLGYECWEILNSENLEGCVVYIIDQRGRRIFEGNSPFTDNCIWDGTVNSGSDQVPEGIYFFILKCENSSFDQTGSILLGR